MAFEIEPVTSEDTIKAMDRCFDQGIQPGTSDIVGQFLFEQMREQKITVASLSQKSGVPVERITFLRLGAVHLYEAVDIMNQLKTVLTYNEVEYSRRLLDASRRKT